MKKTTLYDRAIHAFDEANSRDPNMVTVDGEEHPAERLYAERMSEWLEKLDPNASEVLRLAARCQHIERWVIPRKEYPMNRSGYLKWRNELKKFHAERAQEILLGVGYDEQTVRRVESLVMKRDLKSDPEVQMLEDVICLVFLSCYFEDFSKKHEDEKLVQILRKTWRKMSPKGREAARELDLSERAEALIGRATDQ